MVILVLTQIVVQIINDLFGGAKAPSYIYVYEKDRENNSNTGGD